MVAPVGVDEEDRSLNINADTVAGKIAEAVKAEKLMLLDRRRWCALADGKFLRSLSAADAERLIEEGVITEG